MPRHQRPPRAPHLSHLQATMVACIPRCPAAATRACGGLALARAVVPCLRRARAQASKIRRTAGGPALAPAPTRPHPPTDPPTHPPPRARERPPCPVGRWLGARARGRVLLARVGHGTKRDPSFPGCPITSRGLLCVTGANTARREPCMPIESICMLCVVEDRSVRYRAHCIRVNVLVSSRRRLD
jgi:hypothetical protein